MKAALLPEDTAYRDTGCRDHPACLTCPFERCRYEDGELARRAAMRRLDRAIRMSALQRAGYSPDAIADRFAVSRRTVFRELRVVMAVSR